MQDRKVWEVWDRKVWPPEDYEAPLKNAPFSTMLHFPPPRPHLKNISKIYLPSTTAFRGDILVLLRG
jgi:hypothetical protein